MEIIRCPGCGERMQIYPKDLGKTFHCPACKNPFTAAIGTTQIQASAPAPPIPPPPQTATQKRRWYEEPEPEPAAGEYDEGEYGDDIDIRRLPHRPRKPHRAGTVLTLGIISIIMCAPIFGPMAWIMGNQDLQEMRAGIMDPSGEGQTQAGRTIGMVTTILSLIGLGLVLFAVLLSGVGVIR